MAGYEALLLPAIRRISDRLERATVATEVADYLGSRSQSGAARSSGGCRRQRSQPAACAAEPMRLRSASAFCFGRSCSTAKCRDLLLPRLQASRAARAYSIWPVLEPAIALYEVDPDFSYEALDSPDWG